MCVVSRLIEQRLSQVVDRLFSHVERPNGIAQQGDLVNMY